MQVIKKTNQLRKNITKLKRPLAFVPTMGYLHQGHLSLIDQAKKCADTVVVSIFVNPTQFGPNEDFAKYPRDIKRDLALLKNKNVDIVFVPEVDQIYSADPKNETTIKADKNLTDKLCGLSRPGHFDGVVTVVSKLFNIVQPDFAIFGKKDFQQLLVIKKMVQDLKLPVKVIGADIVREADGLALSSRNKYLDQKQRQDALILSQTLQLAKKLFKKESNISKVKKILLQQLSTQGNLDYLDILNAQDLSEIKTYQKNNTLVALAMYLGKTRLIDNITC